MHNVTPDVASMALTNDAHGQPDKSHQDTNHPTFMLVPSRPKLPMSSLDVLDSEVVRNMSLNLRIKEQFDEYTKYHDYNVPIDKTCLLACGP